MSFTTSHKKSLAICLISLPLAFWTVSARAISCPRGHIFNGENCKPCPPGTYRQEKEPFSKDLGCVPCPAGTYQPYVGVFERSFCRPCYPGSFSKRQGATACVSCEEGLFSYFGASKCENCEKGSRPKVYGTGCEPCPRDWYSDRKVNSECKQCPLGTVTRFPGSSSKADCIPCRIGQSSSQCDCSSAEYRPIGSKECKPCPFGTISLFGARSLKDCRKCPAGKHRGPTMSSCQKCSRRHIAYGPGAMLCSRKDHPCARDHFIDVNGDCRKCQVGFYRSVISKNCQVCKEGTVSYGGIVSSCSKCKNGLHPREGYNDHCVCPLGRFLKFGRCRKCPSGTAGSIDNSGKSVCTECAKGRFASKRGMSECLICPDGLVSLEKGSVKCRKCPMGLVPRVVQVSDLSHLSPLGYAPGDVCVSTSTGCPTSAYYSKYGESPQLEGCLPNRCLRDATKEEVGHTCVACPKGFSLELEFQTYCEQCDKDEVSNGTASAVCKKCTGNLTRNVRDGSKCSCDAPGTGMVNGQCVKCPRGTASAPEDTTCRPCPAGTFTSKVGERSCRNCPEFSFSAKVGSKRCKVCPKGRVPNRKQGASKCQMQLKMQHSLRRDWIITTMQFLGYLIF